MADISKARVDTTRFGEDPLIIGVDPGEKVSASFCALNSEKSVTNLFIKRSSLYQPSLRHRAHMENMCNQRSTQKIQGFDIIMPSIMELQQSLNRNTPIDNLKQFAYVMDELSDFYGSEKVKQLTWDSKKVKRAELDYAVEGALRMASTTGRPTLYVYGNAKFNTHSKLSSLHSSYKGYFYKKVCILSLFP
jgi:hypothetical protein